MALANKFKVPKEQWETLVKEAEARLRQLDHKITEYEAKRSEINRFLGEDDSIYEETLKLIDDYLKRIHEAREIVVKNINTLNDMIGVANIFKGSSTVISVLEAGLKMGGLGI